MKTVVSLTLWVASLLICATVCAQEITLTTTGKNVVASKAAIDFPGLDGNLQAIVAAMPIGETARMNPHPIGAWFYNGKWNIFNTDHATMPEGLQFKVQIFLKPDANHFLHSITPENLRGGVSCIDNRALNNNPNAQVAIFQNHAPDNRSGALNKFAATAAYDATAAKWCIRNDGGERLFANTAYNIVVAPGATTALNPTVLTATPYVPVIATSTAPLALTVVLKTEWTVPPQGAVAHSSGLCKIINGTYNDPSIRATDTVIVTGQSELEGAYLQWSATVEDGAIHFNVCNWKQMTLNAQMALYLNGRKVNLLVLR
jgi:hypothetical protein